MILAISTLLQPPIARTGSLPYASAPASTTYKPPTSKDIPPVTLTNIPHVEPSAFKPYLSHVGSLYDAFQQAKERRYTDALGKAGRGRGPGQGERARPSITGALRRGSSDTSYVRLEGLLESSPGASPDISLGDRGRSRDGTSKSTEQAITPLSIIPPVYFEEDFRLENPRTFEVVSERSDIVRRLPATPREEFKEIEGVNGSARSGRKALATNAILQEKLSWYMDTVELHLISSISAASTSFFAALGSLRALYDEAADSLQKIRSLRSELASLDQNMASGGLRILKMRQRKDNLTILGEAVDQIKEVVDKLVECQDLISKGESQLAIGAVEDIEALIVGESIPLAPDQEGQKISKLRRNLVNLRDIKALEGISGDLSNFRSRIGRAFESQFVDILLSDLRQYIKNAAPSATIRRWDVVARRSRNGNSRPSSVAPTRQSPEDDLRDRLRSCLTALNRCHHTMSANAAYRDAVLREVKNIIRSHLPSSDDDDAESMASMSTRGGRQRTQQEKSTILARNLRALEPDEAEELLTAIYVAISEMLRKVSSQVKMLLDLTTTVEGPRIESDMKIPARSPNIPSLNGYLNLDDPQSSGTGRFNEAERSQSWDISNLIGQLVDVAHIQIAKILKVRTDQTVHLLLSKFLRYFALNRSFADDCETISGRGGSALKSVVNEHIRDFVAQFGNVERQTLAQAMDVDQWDAVDFGESENQLLFRIVEGSTKDADVWINNVTLRIEDQESATKDATKDATANGAPNGKLIGSGASDDTAVPSGRDKVRRAVLDEQKFILPKSALTVLHGVERFEILITSIPSINQEVSSGLLEYLKLFNSRSCQLILGAGATKSAGLKNITTKHLALASQALAFFTALIPYIREFVRRHPMPTPASIVEFDKVKRLYQEHQTGIQDKLVDIMSGRSRTHLNAMRKVNWDDDSTARPAINSYMETLTKETTTLHRVLSKHLPDLAVKMVMGPIFDNYKEQWSQGYNDIAVTSQEGKESMLRDAEAFSNRLAKLDGFGDTGNFVLGVVQGKLGDSQAIARNDRTEISDPKVVDTAITHERSQQGSGAD
ncbi:MAG: hypothetical protein M1816_004794 [Peltula sp. TS41687]|nr:MAG: hypothetical protein M1816_004794 [Peltula sp. TS41687]